MQFARETFMKKKIVDYRWNSIESLYFNMISLKAEGSWGCVKNERPKVTM